METRKAIARRKSIRNFDPGRQVSQQDLETILKAGCAAPIGLNEYDTLRLTAVQNKKMLDKLRETAMDLFSDPIKDIYYGAPTVVIISAIPGTIPEIGMANAGCIAENMMLTATDLGIDSIYIWGTVLAFREDPDLTDEIGLPDGFMPLASVAFGYSETPSDEEKPMDYTIEVNFIK